MGFEDRIVRYSLLSFELYMGGWLWLHVQVGVAVLLAGECISAHSHQTAANRVAMLSFSVVGDLLVLKSSQGFGSPDWNHVRFRDFHDKYFNLPLAWTLSCKQLPAMSGRWPFRICA